MPAKIARADGNFNTASTWGVVDSTSLLDSEAGNDALTTAGSGTRTAAFTPGAITIDGIAVKLHTRAASPSGTMSVHVIKSSDNTEVSGTLVTVNVSDLPTIATAGTTNEGGWVFFKFSGNVTLTGATAYKLEAWTSVGSQVNLYRDATTDNFSRMLRTTTTGAPAAGDQLDIMQEMTGAGAATTRTVTMDQISSSIVDLGSGTDGAAAMTICKGGTVNFAYAAATNYYLKCSGNLIIYNGGTLTIGTVANPIPRDSTAVLEFDPVADGGMGLVVRNGATFTAQGLSRTTGKNIYYCLLNTDEAVNSTSLGVDTDTGWLDNDVIAVASTTRTQAQCEKGALNGNAGASTLTVDGFGGTGGGLAYAHGGTSPIEAEVINLTRNVKIRSTSSTIMSYCYIGPTSTVDIDWVEFYYLGENANDKRGALNIATTTGSCSVQYCSFWNTEDWCIFITGTAANNATFSYNVLYNVCTVTQTNNTAISIPATSGTSITVSYNVVMYVVGGSTGAGIRTSDATVTITYNRIIGVYDYGIYVAEYAAIGNFTNNIIHSGCAAGNAGIALYNCWNGTIDGTKIWRTVSNGLTINGCGHITITNSYFFGNATRNFSFSGANNNMTVENCLFAGDSTFSCPSGVSFSTYELGIFNIYFYNCTFGVASGIYVAHTSNDIVVSTNNKYIDALFEACTFGSSVEIETPNYLHALAAIRSYKHDNTAGSHKTWKRYGTVDMDSTYYNTAAPSEKLTPNNASYKLESGIKKVAVASGATATINVYVRKSSAAAGGADYNGNQPRLIVKQNRSLGISADTVLDTMTAGLNSWEQLSGTTAAASEDGVLEIVVDCDGTTGFVNADDWTVS